MFVHLLCSVFCFFLFGLLIPFFSYYNIPTNDIFLCRWLQILAVVERVLKLYASLRHFFQTTKCDSERFQRIRAGITDPKTLFFLQFLSDVLKPLKSFEIIFQKVSRKNRFLIIIEFLKCLLGYVRLI
jgi:hypothetical protein